LVATGPEYPHAAQSTCQPSMRIMEPLSMAYWQSQGLPQWGHGAMVMM
jgi:hypothetical protein